MSYTFPTLKVITGIIIVILITWFGPTEGDYFTEFLFFGIIFAMGLFVAVHGLFQGIETAVAAATETDGEETMAE
ncbi:hypothetical protein [Halorhabdus amylolytica]|uniref:hypothetical protein n=1 Tax=Halorhabdus amylolytica TaxID=2559573 RepID=UPI0010AA2FB3|nr:hypothetical protein [Halorhabdus amylolytica]